ncbi:Ribosomal protein S18 acetylase RimI [Carnobacterium alterfunditum]|uniref:Ribosomal protein S18 acetylase RimI n=1 Tax=Carnobacterium alterfunditum TaxID=28230 RepID=A0A1N6GQD1_9LACT|nr:GNAT family N-acetyltransferase [Carnobacterium alterfunditum]SIO09776.1 Ribosomal protein S18 acetylase RimI [Carnobacterium alterfunditum]
MNGIEELILIEATVGDIPMIENYVIEKNPYTVTPIDGMTESLHEYKKYPILILDKDKMVGFFILQTGESILNYTSNPHAILLKDHSVDKRYQKRGYGKLSMEKLPEFIKKHFSSINEVILLIDYDNIGGQMMYLKSGFKDTKNRVKDLNGYKFIYSKIIIN